MEHKVIEGTVKWFNDGKGFGFVQHGGNDYFIHYKEIKIQGFKTLKEGARVSFVPGTSQKGRVATNLQVLD